MQERLNECDHRPPLSAKCVSTWAWMWTRTRMYLQEQFLVSDFLPPSQLQIFLAMKFQANASPHANEWENGLSNWNISPIRNILIIAYWNMSSSSLLAEEKFWTINPHTPWSFCYTYLTFFFFILGKFTNYFPGFSWMRENEQLRSGYHLTTNDYDFKVKLDRDFSAPDPSWSHE